MTAVNDTNYTGRVFVVYGVTYEPVEFDLGLLNVQTGYVIHGGGGEYHTGWNIVGGDVNGDGVDDMVISSHGSSPLERYHAGMVTVVAGRRGTRGDIMLNEHHTNEFYSIYGPEEKAYAGNHGVSVDDVNGDGIDDVRAIV